MNRALRECLNASYIEGLLKKSPSSLTHKERFILKERKVAHRALLHRYILSHKLAEKLIEFQKNLQQKLAVLSYETYDISFLSNTQLGGLSLAFFEYSEDPVTQYSLGPGSVTFTKTKERTEASLYSLRAQTDQNLESLYEYFSCIATIIGSRLNSL